MENSQKAQAMLEKARKKRTEGRGGGKKEERERNK